MRWKDYEAKWQRKWEEEGVFVPKAGEGKKFFLTIPYPYTSGALHIGHGRTYTLGDVIARFKRHQGYNVLFPMAFHISGAPILSISDRIADEDARTTNLYRRYVEIYETPENAERIVQSFKDPEKVANYFADKIVQDFRSIGYSIDWTRKFNTGQPRYSRFVQWQYHRLKGKGVLDKGKHPILWDPKVGQPVGEDDIVDGDTDKVAVEEFTAVKFPFEGNFLVAATLRPETLFGATNLWVLPEGIYARARVGGETWFVSREAAEKLRAQGWDVEVTKEFRGRELLGRMAQNPVTEDKLPVLPAEFVDLKEGTGVVYSVPAHAPYDYQALKDLQGHPRFSQFVDLEGAPVIIDLPGYAVPAREEVETRQIRDQEDRRLEEATRELYKKEFYSGVLNAKCGEFAGQRVDKAKEVVREKMVGGEKAFIFYETGRKAVTRSGNPVVVAVIDNQWFLDYNDAEWKGKTRKWLGEMGIYPDKFRKWFLDTVDWLDRRPCARRRGLGTKFPFDEGWVIEPLSDSTIYMAFYTIVHRLGEVEPERLKPEFFDFVFLGKGDAAKLAQSLGVKKDLLKELRGEFLYWYPNDLRHTAPAHISNHLTFFIMHHLAIFPRKHWPQGISLNEMLIREGAKMSKSRGNVIPLADVADKYGADLYRLYVASSADFDAVVDWRERDVAAAANRLRRFIDIIEKAAKAGDWEGGDVDEWFVSRFNLALAEATKHMECLRLRDAVVELLFKLLNDFGWLERRSENPYGTARRVAKEWLVAMAPVIPHTAEEYWRVLGGEGWASLAKWPEAGKVDRKALDREEFIRGVLEQVREVARMAGKEPRRVSLYTAEEWKYRALEAVLKEKERAMKAVGDFKDKKAASKVISSLIGQRVWEKFSGKVDEAAVLKKSRDALKKELGAEVLVNPEKDPLDKQGKAMPFGPAIYVE
jgi:leucyl-tRNA synthetase